MLFAVWNVVATGNRTLRQWDSLMLNDEEMRHETEITIGLITIQFLQ